jgi:hypothetical protein
MSYIHMMRTPPLTVILAAVLLHACRDEGPVREPVATVIVYGRVSVANAAVAPRAWMSLSAHANGSCGGPLVDGGVNAFTDTAGYYRAALYSSSRFLDTKATAGQPRPTVCVWVHARPFPGSRFLATSAQLTPVVMRSDALDSVRVDVELQPELQPSP